MKFLSHFLAFLLATVLALSVSSWILERTLWSAPYIEKQASQTKLYDNLATGIPQAFAHADAGTDTDASGLKNLNPALIQNQLSNLLPQFIDHIHKAGPAPTIDLAALAVSLGQPAPDGPAVKTVNFGSADAKITATGKNLHTAGTHAPFVALAFILLILAVMRDYRFPTLARGAFDTAVALGIAAGLFWFMPNLILQALNKPTLLPIRDAITSFATSLFHGIAAQFGIATLVFIAAAIGLWLAHGAGRIKAKFTPKPKKPPKTSPPVPGSTRL